CGQGTSIPPYSF
nr:immunoglobulin light chain junction region [Macaca mulatta]